MRAKRLRSMSTQLVLPSDCRYVARQSPGATFVASSSVHFRSKETTEA